MRITLRISGIWLLVLISLAISGCQAPAELKPGRDLETFAVPAEDTQTPPTITSQDPAPGNDEVASELESNHQGLDLDEFGEGDAPWPTKGWQDATPESQGMDSQTLAAMFAEIAAEDYAIDNVSVVRNGFLVADAYNYPFQPGERHVIHSCTKSIVSALVGITIAEGYIDGPNTPILELFADRSVANRHEDKETITLEHLLTMSTGLECRDSYLYRWSGLQKMRQSKDWVQYFLDLPMVEPPGERFEYCNGASFTLSAIIQHTTEMSTLEYARQKLFGPLGIEDVEWPTNPQGIHIGWGELQMRPHDMAKIGYLYLNEGQWNGVQVVPADWVAVSTRKHIDGTLQDGYGYQWWIAEPGVYMALGYAGQYIIVVPGQELVAVFTSHLEENDFYTPQKLLETYILPAVKSSSALPENREGQSQLQANIQRLAQP